MKLSKSMKKLLINELIFVIDAMDKEENVEKKLYFFSGIHAVVNRIFNIEFDEDLVFLNHVLKSTHDAFIGRISAIKKAQDSIVPILEIQIEKLADSVKLLLDKIQNDEPFFDILQKLIVLTYTTTGNGYYLLNKGVIKF